MNSRFIFLALATIVALSEAQTGSPCEEIEKVLFELKEVDYVCGKKEDAD